ncbi:MAG: helix-turn-helix transcriptional regulator [Cyanobacteria bacterium J06626_14]
MANLQQFGEFLKVARQRKGLSLRAVEEEVGMSNAYISQLEQGKVKQPSPILLHKLSELYDVKYTDILNLIGYPVPESGDNEGLTDNLSARLGPVTDEEEEELAQYLDFLRSKRNRKE